MHVLLALAIFAGALGTAVAALNIRTALPRISRALRREPQTAAETADQQRWRRVHLAADRAQGSDLSPR